MPLTGYIRATKSVNAKLKWLKDPTSASFEIWFRADTVLQAGETQIIFETMAKTNDDYQPGYLSSRVKVWMDHQYINFAVLCMCKFKMCAASFSLSSDCVQSQRASGICLPEVGVNPKSDKPVGDLSEGLLHVLKVRHNNEVDGNFHQIVGTIERRQGKQFTIALYHNALLKDTKLVTMDCADFIGVGYLGYLPPSALATKGGTAYEEKTTVEVSLGLPAVCVKTGAKLVTDGGECDLSQSFRGQISTMRFYGATAMGPAAVRLNYKALTAKGMRISREYPLIRNDPTKFSQDPSYQQTSDANVRLGDNEVLEIPRSDLMMGSSDCEPCPAGYFCPTEGTMYPIPCGAAEFTQSSGQYKCNQCPIGTYSFEQSLQGVEDCRLVPDGKIGLVAGNGDLNPDTIAVGGRKTDYCAEGYFCPEGSTETTATAFPCPPGFWCRRGTKPPNDFKSEGCWVDKENPLPCKEAYPRIYGGASNNSNVSAISSSRELEHLPPSQISQYYYCPSEEGSDASRELNPFGSAKIRDCRACLAEDFYPTRDVITDIDKKTKLEKYCKWQYTGLYTFLGSAWPRNNKEYTREGERQGTSFRMEDVFVSKERTTCGYFCRDSATSNTCVSSGGCVQGTILATSTSESWRDRKLLYFTDTGTNIRFWQCGDTNTTGFRPEWASSLNDTYVDAWDVDWAESRLYHCKQVLQEAIEKVSKCDGSNATLLTPCNINTTDVSSCTFPDPDGLDDSKFDAARKADFDRIMEIGLIKNDTCKNASHLDRLGYPLRFETVSYAQEFSSGPFFKCPQGKICSSATGFSMVPKQLQSCPINHFCPPGTGAPLPLAEVIEIAGNPAKGNCRPPNAFVQLSEAAKKCRFVDCHGKEEEPVSVLLARMATLSLPLSLSLSLSLSRSSIFLSLSRPSVS